MIIDRLLRWYCPPTDGTYLLSGLVLHFFKTCDWLIGENSMKYLIILCIGAFLYARYRFLLISNKFCDLSLLPLAEGSAVRKIYCTVLTHSPPKPSNGPCTLMFIKLPMDLWLIRPCIRNAFDAGNSITWTSPGGGLGPRNGFARIKSITYGGRIYHRYINSYFALPKLYRKRNGIERTRQNPNKYRYELVKWFTMCRLVHDWDVWAGRVRGLWREHSAHRLLRARHRLSLPLPGGLTNFKSALRIRILFVGSDYILVRV